MRSRRSCVELEDQYPAGRNWWARTLDSMPRQQSPLSAPGPFGVNNVPVPKELKLPQLSAQPKTALRATEPLSNACFRLSLSKTALRV